jgi:hypothetical protein
MEIEITAAAEDMPGYVSFRCAYGSASAKWEGSSPAVPGIYHVEIELSDVIVGWEVELELPAIDQRIRQDADGAVIVGIVEGIGEDGVINYRVESDVLLIELAEKGEIVHLGDVLSVRPEHMLLYPYSL